MACCILIFLYIKSELSYDRYHKDADSIFRVAQIIQRESAETTTARVATPLIPAIRENFPEVKHAARFQLSVRDNLVERNQKMFYEDWVMIAENDIFSVFTIPFIKGNPVTALNRPGTVVISERIATKYFEDEDPIGETLKIWGNPFEVTGVVSNCPENTHLKYDFIVSLNGFEKVWNLNNWGWTGFYAYVKLKPNINADLFEGKIRHVADLYIKERLEKWGATFSFYLQPISSIHLFSNLNEEIVSPGNLTYIYTFSVIGFLILLISCINFTNLTTARSANRTKEVGIRKVVGAHRLQLARQFLWETMLTAFVSLLGALMLVSIALPIFNDLTAKHFDIGYLMYPYIVLTLIGLALLVGLAAGSYPAFLLSLLRPARILKGSLGPDSRGTLLRKVLVVGQFSITITLVIATLIVYRQISFMKNMHLGFDKEQKLIIPGNYRNNYEYVKAEFTKHPSITGATVCWNVPGRMANTIEAHLEGEEKDKAQTMSFYYFDHDFIPEYNIEIAAGRPFQWDIRSDIEDTFIINEAAARAFGFSSLEEAIGKKMYEGGSGNVGTIIGVTKDFHFKGLQTKIEPLVMQFHPGYFSNLSLTVKTENLEETLSFVKKKWHELHLGKLFSYFFLDENFNRQYGLEEKLGRLFTAFTSLAIFISCLGLVGLSSFTTEQRTKEIGIRKVLGASIPNILNLLSKEFSKWVIFSNIIAWPVAYFVMDRWLQNFAYRTSIRIEIFILSGLLTFVLALTTVSYQSIKAAIANPIETLRFE